MCLEQLFVKKYDSGHPDECFGALFFQIINLEVPKCKHRAIFLAHRASFLIPRAGPMCQGQFFPQNYDSGHPDEPFGTPNMGIAKFLGRTASNTTYWPHCAAHPQLIRNHSESDSKVRIT